ncbi:MAG: hypothetical protein JEY94_04255 [Melioribacteraceae bacterium]|nr:hypothetical protein [Melioribacteraceae bacterium]
MSDYFWIFLSIAVFMGILLPVVAILTKHKHTMKLLEIEALKVKKENLKSEDGETVK